MPQHLRLVASINDDSRNDIRNQAINTLFPPSRPQWFDFGRSTPERGALVQFQVHIQSCVPGDPPIADYSGTGTFLGESCDGYMTKAITCTDPRNIGEVIFTRSLHSLEGVKS